MTRYVSGLTLLFAAERRLQEKCDCNNKEEEEVRVEKNEIRKIISSDVNDTGSSFQMPLHYPSYAKKDYEAMSESELDRLLAVYGLPTDGDLDYKREFAIGAFEWPDFRGQQITPSPSLHTIQDCRIVEFLCRVLGFAN